MSATQRAQKCVRCILTRPRTLNSTSTSTSSFSPSSQQPKAVVRRQFSSSRLSRSNQNQNETQNQQPEKSMSQLLSELGARPKRTNPLDFIPFKAASTSQSRSPVGTVTEAPDWLKSNLGQSLLRDLSRSGPSTLSSTMLRLRPSLGRTIRVIGQDLGSALTRLERRCAENSIKKDARAQLFHVRKGAKRKLLKTQRSRALFKEGFIAECARIRRMRKQGW
ncbi:hypothetical protein PV10_07030 [Exophiala mesophila]|uniref:Ribosomal protein S21 n=1 Tax=Exophiala mesophila TaxID=212818 RepID=A0A0D1WKY2_EXOME|nr:uncharacterized protein PV10_07030 [Exophiala mesophila]KIV89645.1 hypothetical protein PV10_07030 [Exophiala mesophila]